MHSKHMQKHEHLRQQLSPELSMCYPEFQSARLCTEPSLKPGRRPCVLTLAQVWNLRYPTTEQAGRGEGIPLLSQLLNHMRTAQLS